MRRSYPYRRKLLLFFTPLAIVNSEAGSENSRKVERMTSVDVVFKYLYAPTESVMRAMDNVREVYGIRRVRFNDSERTVRVEYDATRLNQDSVAALLRRTGLELGEKLQLI